MSNISDLKLTELRKLAQQYGIKYYYKMNKQELIDNINSEVKTNNTQQYTNKGKYDELNVKQLREKLKKRNIKGYSKINKAELLRILYSSSNGDESMIKNGNISLIKNNNIQYKENNNISYKQNDDIINKIKSDVWNNYNKLPPLGARIMAIGRNTYDRVFGVVTKINEKDSIKASSFTIQIVKSDEISRTTDQLTVVTKFIPHWDKIGTIEGYIVNKDKNIVTLKEYPERRVFVSKKNKNKSDILWQFNVPDGTSTDSYIVHPFIC